MSHLRTAVLTLCLLAGVKLAAAANADAWKSQIIYFMLTDRFSPPPGVQPASSCKLTDWNSGTWSGITDKLDYIQDLGMTSIWITPIPYSYQGNFFGFTGYAGYWAEDWTRLEPHFGTEQDLQQLLNATKTRGMLTMLDVVANHVGPVGNNFSSIVPFNSSEHYHGCSQGCDENCNIPQSAYDINNLEVVETCRLLGLPDLNQTVPFVKQQLLAWLNNTLTKFDFDGIRIDTVKHVHMPFWREFTAGTTARGTFSIGEVMIGDSKVLAEYLTGPEPAMNSLLNFPLYYKFVNVFQKQQDMRELLSERQKQQQLLGPQLMATLGVFVDNHDFPRFLSQQPDQQLLKNALAFALLTEGIPIVYYGTEKGFKGGSAGDANRECMWETGFNDTQGELYGLIRTLAGLRTNRSLWETQQLDLNVTSSCYIFSRGPDLLVVTTNIGGNSSSSSDDVIDHNADKPPVFKLAGGGSSSSSSGASDTLSCVVTLPDNVTVLDKGVKAVTDILKSKEASATGLKWEPASRTLTIQLAPSGAPRVLSTTKFIVGNTTTTNNNNSNNSSSSNTSDKPKPEWKPPAAHQGGAASSSAASSSWQQQPLLMLGLARVLLMPLLLAAGFVAAAAP